MKRNTERVVASRAHVRSGVAQGLQQPSMIDVTSENQVPATTVVRGLPDHHIVNLTDATGMTRPTAEDNTARRKIADILCPLGPHAIKKRIQTLLIALVPENVRNGLGAAVHLGGTETATRDPTNEVG